MKNYCGYNPGTDLAQGGGKFVDEHDGDCMEVNNFLIYNKKCYGYFMHYGNKLDLERLGKEYKNVSAVHGVTVVWVSTNPNSGGRYIVGWYENATMYRDWQFYEDNAVNEGGVQDYNFIADSKNCYLIPESLRTHQVPSAPKNGKGKGMGQSQIWYADGEWAQTIYIPEVLQYFQSIKGKCQKLFNDYSQEELNYVASDKYDSLDGIYKELDELEAQGWYSSDTKRIIGLYNLAVEKEPSGVTYFNLGVFLKDIFYLDEAAEAFKKSLSLDPNNIMTQCFLLDIYYSLKMRTLAILLGEKIAGQLRDDPKEDVEALFRIYVNLYCLYFNEKAYDKAAECIRLMKNVKFISHQEEVKLREKELAQVLSSK